MHSTPRPAGAFHRAIWRWHFYAGIIVLPVLLWLAATGALYLYKPEIEDFVYRDWSVVQATGKPQPIAALIAAVERQTGAKVTQVSRPASPAESWRMTLRRPDGSKRMAFVDPYRATLIGTTSAGGVMDTIRLLHSLAITGPIGNALVEIVAGWAVVLVVTGLILWWPRGGSPLIGVRGKPKGRLFWRDLHGSIGALAAAVILFLAVTGMPWSGVAGEWLDSWVNAQRWGRPERPVPGAVAKHEGHEGHHEAVETLPWSMQRKPPPASKPGPVTPDLAAERAEWAGLAAPWTMSLPSKPGAPYLLSAPIVRAEDAHALYIDAASGAVLQDARYAEFGGGAQAIEWGIATHQGQQYGEPNRLLMLAGCIATWLLGITGTIAWWKRRTGGKLRAPPPALDRRRTVSVAGAMVVLGALFPLTGLTMVVALAGEGALALRRR